MIQICCECEQITVNIMRILIKNGVNEPLSFHTVEWYKILFLGVPNVHTHTQIKSKRKMETEIAFCAMHKC